MASTFQDNEIEEFWSELFSGDSYRSDINDIASNYPQRKSLTVDFEDISGSNIDFSIYVLDYPDRCLEIAKKSVMSMVPNVLRPGDDIKVRITNLPRDATVEVRNLRADHLGKLVAVEGLARKVTTVKPRMTNALYRCARCFSEIWIPQPGMIRKEPLMCNNPEGSCNRQATRFILDEKESLYVDTQKIEIQESPEGLRGGAQPERLTGYVEDDIAGLVTAGNRITLNGILRSEEKSDRDKSTVFEIYLDVISVEFEQHEYDEIIITAEDEQRILEMSRDPELFDNIVHSISPSIYGLDMVKQAIALQLFGGTHKEMDDGTVMRGDMHILLMGDPGVAKSQLLRYMSMLAPRGIYASGKSASAAGLTAAAVRDDFGDGRWTLEAGALVLADKGLACIDELDKMTDQDRSSLHEAMESQKISVAKAGITATLQCRCSMLAAANPKYGRFESDMPLSDQIDLPPALMSRFDMIFVLTDKPDKKLDRDISKHILSTHQRGQARMAPEGEKFEDVDIQKIMERTDNIRPVYDIETLRKYVAYSKRINPIMTDKAMDLIQNSYLGIREMSKDGGSVSITARQLEAFIRLSEASAKMRLSQTVTEDDAKRAIELVEYYLRRIAGSDDGGFDIDKLMSGVSSKDRKSVDVIRDIFNAFGANDMSLDEIIQHGLEMGVEKEEITRAVNNMNQAGEIFCPRPGLYRRT
ncbi:MAG: minichromosome maintenance protein MCM [Candidatus Methanomethylophilaceae archaeon]|nr:minichromosome maintenance protein MCM [Candidatus Methanomethylophilaceae archaeon]